jgi:hypothetical protein
VKSGGHDPNPNHSAINGGVLIALSQLNGTALDAKKGVAYVKPGGTWSTAVRALKPNNVTVVGGRLGTYNLRKLIRKYWVVLMGVNRCRRPRWLHH